MRPCRYVSLWGVNIFMMSINFFNRNLQILEKNVSIVTWFLMHDIMRLLIILFSTGHVFNLKGHCPRGISCRFGSKHITENGRNIINEATKDQFEKNIPKTLTFYTREIENDLRKRTYDFKKSEEVLDILPKSKPPPPVAPFGPFNTPFWGPGWVKIFKEILKQFLEWNTLVAVVAE